MKLVSVEGKLWWVPESNSTKLAVQIQTEREYYPAIRAKLEALMEKESDPLGMVTWIMEPQGLEVEPTQDLENLVLQVLATSSVGEMVRAGSPYMALPEDSLLAIEAVEAQCELTLADFLA